MNQEAINNLLPPNNNGEGNVLCFVVDTTASMTNWITAVKNVMAEIVDVSAMTRAFDAIGVLEYGDYCGSWQSAAHVPNTYGCGGNIVAARFSGWGVVGDEAKRPSAVLSESARVSVDAIHAFCGSITARGGGGFPEAFKTAMVQLAYISKTTLSDACRLHVLHLTDAPCHMDVKENLDVEGIEERKRLPEMIAAVHAAQRPLPPSSLLPPPPPPSNEEGASKDKAETEQVVTPPSTAANANKKKEDAVESIKEREATYCMAIYKLILDTLTSSKEASSAHLSSATITTTATKTTSLVAHNSRFKYTCVCSCLRATTPFSILATLTGGNVIVPTSLSEQNIRATLQALLNAWMGVVESLHASAAADDDDGDSPASPSQPNDDNPLQPANIPCLVLKKKKDDSSSAATTNRHEQFNFDDNDTDVFDNYECCSRGEHVASSPLIISSDPVIKMEPTIRRALERCLSRVLPSAAEKMAEARAAANALKKKRQGGGGCGGDDDNNETSTNDKLMLKRREAEREEYLVDISRVLYRICSKSPMALCSSPPLGKIWRAFTRRAGDPRRDAFIASLESARKKLSQSDCAIFDAWNTFSYDATDEIFAELRAFVDTEGVKGLVYFDKDGEEGEAVRAFTAQSVVNAFNTCNAAAQAIIMKAPLTRLRIDPHFVYAVPTEAEANVEANNDGVDDNDAADLLPFPSNALPLNLPLPSLFRLLLSVAVPGSQLSLRPAAILAALAYRSGSVLKDKAAEYLNMVAGQWISWNMCDFSNVVVGSSAAPEGGWIPNKSIVSTNFGAAFLDTVLSTHIVAESNRRAHKSSGDGAADAAGVIIPTILTPTELQSAIQLSRLHRLLHCFSWEVTVKMIDVKSVNGVTYDYTLPCKMCRVERPWSLMSFDDICGYCKMGQTAEGEAIYGRSRIPDPNFKPESATTTATATTAASNRSLRVSRPTIPLPPAPAPTKGAEEGTYQVRCGGCYGYYAFDRSRIMQRAHRCFYCREATAKEAAEELQVAASLSATSDAKGPKKVSGDEHKADADAEFLPLAATPFPHVKYCVSCNIGIIGAPTRPLPGGGRCASCFYSSKKKEEDDNYKKEEDPLVRRPCTTTDRVTTIGKLFPQRAFWRNLAAAVGLKLRPMFDGSLISADDGEEKNANTNAVPERFTPKVLQMLSKVPLPPSGVIPAAQVFAIPGMEITNFGNNPNAVVGGKEGDAKENNKPFSPYDIPYVPHTVPADFKPKTAMPPLSNNKKSSSTSNNNNEPNIGDISPMYNNGGANPYLTIVNGPQLWASLVKRVFGGKNAFGFSGEDDNDNDTATTNANNDDNDEAQQQHRNDSSNDDDDNFSPLAICAVCCEVMKDSSQLKAACGRRGCDQRLCKSCAVEWYSAETSGNKRGSIMKAPRRLRCPCCARAPSAKVLYTYNPDAVVDNVPRAVDAINTDVNVIGWCGVCGKVEAAGTKECEAAMEAAGVAARANAGRYVCADCTSVTIDAYRKCPQCAAPTFRVSGCFHITCVCGQHWCYDCEKGFEDATETYEHHCSKAGEGGRVDALWDRIEEEDGNM